MITLEKILQIRIYESSRIVLWRESSNFNVILRESSRVTIQPNIIQVIIHGRIHERVPY